MTIRQLSLHLFLFLITFLSTLAAGALQKGINIIAEPYRIIEGFPFAVSLMAILLTHELSHYFASRKHHTAATLPYFIPAPSIIGTFGAFIKMKSPIITRKALVDIGASGPIAGFIVALIVTVYGLHHSEFVSIYSGRIGITLGDSILFSLLSRLIVGVPPVGKDILINPVAFAGWIGFFVTSMNLLPIGQLDGGHIAYALLGDKRHKRLSFTLTTLLAVAGLSGIYLSSGLPFSPVIAGLKNVLWEGWAIWALLLFILGLNHPPVIYWENPLERSRKYIGWISLIIFILTFIPVPFRVV
jgi:membrane-associated protease RseP (regulator of RpoE activity)